MKKARTASEWRALVQELDASGASDRDFASHARHKFCEAAIAKVEVAREALFRIGRFFERDAGWASNPPATIKDGASGP